MNDTAQGNQPSVGATAPTPGNVIVPPSPSETVNTTPSIPVPVNTTPVDNVASPNLPPATFETGSGSSPLKAIGLVILALVVIGAFAGVGYYLGNQRVLVPAAPAATATPEATVEPTPTPTPTPDPTADWKSYNNTDYKFTFKHPTDWEVRDMLSVNKVLAAHKDDLVFLGMAPITLKEDVLGSVIVKKLDQAAAVTAAKTFPAGAPNKVVSEGKITFAGYSADEIVNENSTNKITSKTIVFSTPKETYIITGGGSEDNTLINQIISTFKFTAADTVKGASATPKATPTIKASATPTASPKVSSTPKATPKVTL